MFLTTIAVALVLFLVGGTFCFAGYRFFHWLIPIWGFVAGFLTTATVIRDLYGGGFLATAAGWAFGVVIGLLIAVVAFTFYYVAVVILGASLGFMLGIGAASLFGSLPGWLIILVGVIAAVDAALLIVLLDLPKGLIVVFSALSGAGAIISGVLLLFGQISLESLRNGIVGDLIRGSWVWLVVYLALAIVGIVVQSIASRGYRHTQRPARTPKPTSQPAQAPQTSTTNTPAANTPASQTASGG
ncbi:MAG TPA: DUF4203 domain-containing protein [Ktedonobacterales bacterium]|nr:DUF4203 domain-containing protein [Ktedonobacterales bacterium]